MKESKKKYIRFKDLSGWLKVAIVSAWVVGGIYLSSFIIGFVIGLIEAL